MSETIGEERSLPLAPDRERASETASLRVRTVLCAIGVILTWGSLIGGFCLLFR